MYPEYPFQPTRPLRGATLDQREKRQHVSHFNPRAPCGARLGIGYELEDEY